MTATELRDVREANPFRPFTIHLTDGRSFYVPHRDFVSQSPTGRIIVVYRSDGGLSIVDLYLVTDLEFATPADAETPGNQA
jgi:hypothetical protein